MRARAEDDVRQQTLILLETMNCYNQSVVQGAKTAGIKPTMNFREKRVGIPFAFAFTMELGEQFKRNPEIQMEMRVYSDYPFLYRGPNYAETMDEWESEALQKLRANPDEPVKEFAHYRSQPALRYATAVIMRPECVGCHNRNSAGDKHDWKAGDVRGVLEVIRPLARDIDHTNNLLRSTYLLLGGTAVALLLLCGVVLMVGRRYRR
jgi:adenylate cyclase